MNSLVRSLFDGVREDRGYPVRLSKLLKVEPGIRFNLAPLALNIAASSVVRWQDFGKHAPLSWPRRAQGEMMGWQWSSGRYSSFVSQRSEFEVLAQCHEVPGWRCDIARVDGFSGSKSRLEDFASTDDMVETNSMRMIDRVDDEKLAENLAHKEIRILHDPATSDHLRYCAWDQRVFLMNSGDSHHLAAAKYLAARLDRRVPIEGKLVSYSLNSAAIGALCRDFEIFAVNDDEAEHSNAFHDAMCSRRRPGSGSRCHILTAMVEPCSSLAPTRALFALPTPCDRPTCSTSDGICWARQLHSGCYSWLIRATGPAPKPVRGVRG